MFFTSTIGLWSNYDLNGVYSRDGTIIEEWSETDDKSEHELHFGKKIYDIPKWFYKQFNIYDSDQFEVSVLWVNKKETLKNGTY